MRTGLSPLGGLMQALVGALGLEPGLLGQRAVDAWPEVAGERIAAHAWAESVRGDTLWVVTDSPVWSHQLQMLAGELAARLREAVGPGCPVSQIRFRSGGPGPGLRTGASGERPPGRSVAAALPPPRPGDRRLIEEAAAWAQDEPLAAALRKLFAAQAGVRWPPSGSHHMAESPPGTRSSH